MRVKIAAGEWNPFSLTWASEIIVHFHINDDTVAKSQKKTFTKAFKNSKFDKTRHLLDLIWPRSGSELIVPFQNTHTVIENTMFKPHGADPRVSSHSRPHWWCVDACSKSTWTTHIQSKSILTNILHAMIGRWWLLIIQYSWSSCLVFFAVHVHKRSKELPHRRTLSNMPAD